jgi:hypothetical protein
MDGEFGHLLSRTPLAHTFPRCGTSVTIRRDVVYRNHCGKPSYRMSCPHGRCPCPYPILVPCPATPIAADVATWHRALNDAKKNHTMNHHNRNGKNREHGRAPETLARLDDAAPPAPPPPAPDDVLGALRARVAEEERATGAAKRARFLATLEERLDMADPDAAVAAARAAAAAVPDGTTAYRAAAARLEAARAAVSAAVADAADAEAAARAALDA